MPLVEPVAVYGGTHSPWVQAVLLGLHEKRVTHTVQNVPPLRLFLDSGVFMPAARIAGRPWIYDSAAILGEFGFSPVDEADRKMLIRTFGTGALQRTSSVWGFWKSWCTLQDGHPSRLRQLWHHLTRPFSVLYFFTVITMMRRRIPLRTANQLGEDFEYWETRLTESGPFLSGETPDTVDLQLFGQVQMFASIPCTSLNVLQEDPRLPKLREWTSRMQQRFAEYPHLFSGPYFEPRSPAPERSAALDQLLYWLGCLTLLATLPLALAAVLYFTAKVARKNLR